MTLTLGGYVFSRGNGLWVWMIRDKHGGVLHSGSCPTEAQAEQSLYHYMLDEEPMSYAPCRPPASAASPSYHILVSRSGMIRVVARWMEGMWSLCGEPKRYTPAEVSERGWTYYRHVGME